MREKSEGEMLFVAYSDEAYVSVQLGTSLISHLPAFLGISLRFCSLHHFLFPMLSVSIQLTPDYLWFGIHRFTYLHFFSVECNSKLFVENSPIRRFFRRACVRYVFSFYPHECSSVCKSYIFKGNVVRWL